MTAITLYLASASPRRKAILDNLGIPCELRPQAIDECLLEGESPEDYVCRLARAKAEVALAGLENRDAAACLGSDTTVVCDGEIFEKPRDKADAYRILKTLSGKNHQVLTAVALATRKQTEVQLNESEVTFRALSDSEIDSYWASGEPVDKAGGYGIQGLGAIFVKEIRGSYSGIMGLPVMETVTLLGKIGFTAQVILEGRAGT